MAKRLPALESLRFLEACVRHSNFRRAAEELGVTPTAVSLRIRDLEAEMGTKFFDRFGPRVEPTDIGIALAARLTEALATIRSAVDESRCSTEPLRITVVPTFAARWLAPRLAAYHALADSVAIRLDVSADLRTAQDFDVAIRTGHGEWPGFDAVALMPVESAPMLSPKLMTAGKINSPQDLAELPLLPHDQWHRWFRESGAQVSELRYCADEYPTYDLDATAAIDGVGVAMLSPTLFASLINERKLVQPFFHVLEGPEHYWLLTHSGEKRSHVVRFREWAKIALRPG